MKLETVKVHDKVLDRVRTINAADFDIERHELVAAKVTKDGGDVTPAKPAETAKKTVKKSTTKATKKQPEAKKTEEAPAPEAKPAYKVAEKEDKFIIVDEKGKQYDEQIFNTKEEAEFFVNML